MVNKPTLRETLASALRGRQAALRNGRSHRKDIAALNAGMGRIEAFLHSYPYADDARVKQWCEAHVDDVAMVVPGNSPTSLARLVSDTLALRAHTLKSA